MNRKELAIELCKRETGRVQVSVAQMSEIIKCLFEIAGEMAERGEAMNMRVKKKDMSKRKFVAMKKERK